MLLKLRHPVRAIREPFGTAGLILACIALIAALTGGAYAASGGLTAKQKKEVKKIAKQFAGKPGAPGAAGPAGAKGDAGGKGDTGAAGSNGTNGTNGTNGLQGPEGEAGMCSEEQPECVLPAGGTLTGTWSASGAETVALSTISFPLQVSPAPTAVQEEELGGFKIGYELKDGGVSLVGPWKTLEELEDKDETFDPGHNVFERLEEDQAAYLPLCPGSAKKPKAAPGFLCIYVRDTQGTGGFEHAYENEALGQMSQAATEFGVTVPFKMSGSAFVRGTWAVTN